MNSNEGGKKTLLGLIEKRPKVKRKAVRKIENVRILKVLPKTVVVLTHPNNILSFLIL